MLVPSCSVVSRLFGTPWTAACQASLSMGFSRQEYRNGLPCPPPGHLPNPGIKPRSPSLQADSLPAEPPGKPKNTGVGSLSHLQGIFPTQESNRGLLHCRWILYQLSYQGTPFESSNLPKILFQWYQHFRWSLVMPPAGIIPFHDGLHYQQKTAEVMLSETQS